MLSEFGTYIPGGMQPVERLQSIGPKEIALASLLYQKSNTYSYRPRFPALKATFRGQLRGVRGLGVLVRIRMGIRASIAGKVDVALQFDAQDPAHALGRGAQLPLSVAVLRINLVS